LGDILGDPGVVGHDGRNFAGKNWREKWFEVFSPVLEKCFAPVFSRKTSSAPTNYPWVSEDA